MNIVLNTFGTSLNCDKGCFIIKTKDGVSRIPAEGVNSISLSKGSQITSDAVILAIENEIDILFNDRGGKPVGRVWSSRYGSISTIRKGQVNFAQSQEAVRWIKDTIRKKIENQQAMIEMMEDVEVHQTHHKKKAVARLQEYIEKIESLEGEHISEIAQQIRGWEGVSSKIYFDALNIFIDEKYRFEGRSQRPALDVFNALLNYGYGILYGKIEGALIKAGIDPYIGVLHRDEYNRPVLVYDIIELYRIWIDYIVFNIIRQDIITDEFYSVRHDGSYWLENLGRRVIIQAVNDYLEEHIKVGALERSRLTHIQLYAQELAQKFKKYEKK